MARYIEHLIEDVREATENEEFTITTGIQDREFIRYLTEAQQRLHNRITQQHPRVFESEKTYTVSRNQEYFELPSDIHIKNMVTQVEYKRTGFDEDYIVLKPTSSRNRMSNSEGCPRHYFVKDNKIFITPRALDSGSLRVGYIRQCSSLHRRMGLVETVVLGANTITSLDLDVALFGVDSPSLERADEHFTVVDSQGNIKMKAVRFTDINTTSGLVTIHPDFVFEEGESIEAGDYLVVGKNSSSHIDVGLTATADRYIEAYGAFKVLKRDSSVDSQEQFQELSLIEQEIVDSYAEILHDVTEIPNINSDGWWF